MEAMSHTDLCAPDELHLLATAWRSGRSQIPSESLLLVLQHFLADAYQPPVRLPLTPGLAGRLNGLFQSDEIRRRTVGSDGQPLHLESNSTGWEMVEASDFLYRFELKHKGEVPDTRLLMLPGPMTLYWFGSTLLEAGPPPFPVDSLECDPVIEIPRSAVESVPGIRYLLDTIPVLPDALAKRVTRHAAQTCSSGPHRADRMGRIGRLCSSVGRSTSRNGDPVFWPFWLESLGETRGAGRRSLRRLSTRGSNGLQPIVREIAVRIRPQFQILARQESETGR